MDESERGEFEASEFDALFDAHYARLHQFARRRLADPSVVEDVVADTFVVAWRRRAEIPDPPLPWLFGVCTRVISTQRRSSDRRHRLWSKLASGRQGLGRDPAELQLERSELSEAFARLTAEQREVLRLVAWDGLDSAEGAEVLGCTPAAFRVRLHRARRELEKHLAPSGHEEMQDGKRDQFEVTG